METFKSLKKRAERIQALQEASPYRTLLRRMASGFIDVALLTVPAMVFIIVEMVFSLPAKQVLLMAFFQLTSVTYNVFCVSRFGTTVGKFLWGMKVVTHQNEQTPLTPKRAFLREALNAVSLVSLLALMVVFAVEGRFAEIDSFVVGKRHDLFIDIWTVLGDVIFWSELVTAAFSRQRRAVHDIVAGTVVIKGDIPKKTMAVAALLASAVVFYAYNQATNVLK